MKKEKIPMDVYDQVLMELETFYGEIPNRRGFYQAVKSTLREDECKLWLLFPTHEQTPVSFREMRERYQDQFPDIDRMLERLDETCFAYKWEIKDGEQLYVRNFLFQFAISYNKNPAIPPDDPMAIASGDWFNAMVLGGSKNMPFELSEFRVVPQEETIGTESGKSFSMGMEIPDTREVVPYDYVTEMLKTRRTICLTSCYCRLNKQMEGTKECDYPLDTCMLFDTLGERMLDAGFGRKLTVDEAIAMTLRAEKDGLVHCISNAVNPTVLCQCCDCCCLVLQSMKRGELTCGKPSRFRVQMKREKCLVCGKCQKKCPVQAIRVADNKLSYDANRCIGCGFCTSACKEDALSMVLREDAATRMPDFETIDILYI